MRSYGYVKVPRSWCSLGPENPFGPPSTISQQAKLVALTLMSWAPYHKDDPKKGLIEITYTKLSEATGYGRSSLFRVIQFLVKEGFLKIVQARKAMQIQITETLTKYLHKGSKLQEKTKKDVEIPKDENPGKTGKKTRKHLSIQNEIPGTENPGQKPPLTCCDHCHLFFDQETPWNAHSNLGTQNQQNGDTASTDKDSETSQKNPAKDFCLKRKREFYISLRDMYIKEEEKHYTHSSRSPKKYRQDKTPDTNQQEDGAPKRQKVSKPKKSHVPPEQEEQLDLPIDPKTIPEEESAFWKLANGYAIHLNGLCGMSRRRLPVRRFKEQMRRLQDKYGISIEELREMVEAKYEHPFWGKFQKEPWTLTQPNKWSDDPWADIYEYSRKRKKIPSAKERSLKSVQVIVCEVTGKKWFQGNEVP